tara:strand:+ start:83 stop:670 length:588 start_codon:yes stop_codon:yes gene_type:complete
MIHVDPPFDLGSTLKGTDDASELINSHWEGAIFEFPDVDKTPALRGGKGRRSGQQIKAIVVRNTSGGALTVAKKCLKIDLTPSDTRKIMGSVDGQCSAVNQVGGVGDNELTGDVAANDLFWLIIAGPAECLVKASETHAVGSLLCSSATAGALALGTSGSAAVAMASAANVVARATIAGTSSAAAVVVNVCSNIG